MFSPEGLKIGLKGHHFLRQIQFYLVTCYDLDECYKEQKKQQQWY